MSSGSARPAPAPDNPSLLARAAGGDEGAWRCVVASYAPRVFALVRSRCRDDDLAEEITQAVFVTMAEKLGAGGYDERGRFEAWLFRVAMNRFRDHARKAKRQASPVDPATLDAGADTRPGPADGADRPADLSRLREALEALSEADREIVHLRHHAGLTFKQIAEVLQEPLGTLLARHHRALAKLRKVLGEPDEHPNAEHAS
ncbi:MAG: sigma-70 family RNA polymerase sigma factor [Phycisphaerales bacterium]|nr:sigma-70 family RNA polymerase sigma factor [Phycisphaerales bacterium]